MNELSRRNYIAASIIAAASLRNKRPVAELQRIKVSIEAHRRFWRIVFFALLIAALAALSVGFVLMAIPE